MNESGDRREGTSEITREIQWMPKGATEPRTVRVRVTLPEPSSDLPGYECKVMFEGFEFLQRPGEPSAGTFHDYEPMLALTAALNMVPEVIEYHIKRLGGRVLSRLRGHQELDDEEPPGEAGEEAD